MHRIIAVILESFGKRDSVRIVLQRSLISNYILIAQPALVIGSQSGIFFPFVGHRSAVPDCKHLLGIATCKVLVVCLLHVILSSQLVQASSLCLRMTCTKNSIIWCVHSKRIVILHIFRSLFDFLCVQLPMLRFDIALHFKDIKLQASGLPRVTPQTPECFRCADDYKIVKIEQCSRTASYVVWRELNEIRA